LICELEIDIKFMKIDNLRKINQKWLKTTEIDIIFYEKSKIFKIFLKAGNGILKRSVDRM